MAFRVEIEGLTDALHTLDRLASDCGRTVQASLNRMGLIVQRRAVWYAPVSPTATQLRSLRKTTRKVKRKATATSRPKPGGLMRSIQLRVVPGNAEIFVAANSEAGRYGFRIHEEKGVSWINRGPGTVAKGAQADAKFIERAIRDSEGELFRIVYAGIERVIP